MSWLQITFECNAAAAERFTPLLEELGAVSVTLLDAADEPIFEPPRGTAPLWGSTRVIALFEEGTDSEQVLLGLAARIAPDPLPPVRMETLEDQDWTRSWMADFQPSSKTINTSMTAMTPIRMRRDGWSGVQC